MALNSVVGSLRVNLGLDTATFDRGMRRAERTVENFSASLGGFVAAGAAAAAAGLGVLVGSSLNAAKEMRTMLSIADASPREFQRLAAGAAAVGIDMDKMADITKDVQDRIGDFIQTGGGPMADFFNNIAPKVGVTADQFARLSGPEALQLFVTSMERANLTQEDMTFYMEALASDSTRLLPLLRNNATEMNRIADAAEEFGGFFTESDLRQLNAANTQLGRVKTGIVAVANDLGVALAPAIESVAKFLADSLKEDGALRSFFNSIISNLQQISVTIAVAGAAWVASMVMAAASTQGVLVGVLLLKGALAATGFGLAVIAVGYLVNAFIELVQSTGSVTGAIQSLVQDFSWVISTVGILAAGFATAKALMFALSLSLKVVAGSTTMLAAGLTSTTSGLTFFTLKALSGTAIVSALSRAFAVLTAVMAVNPFVLLAAAVVGVVAAIFYLVSTFDKVAAGLGGIDRAWQAFSDVAMGAINYVIGLLVSIPMAVSEIGFGIIAAFASAFADILKMAIDLVNNQINAFEGFVAATGVILGSLVGFFANVATNAGNAFIDALGAALTKGAEMLNSILSYVGLEPIAPPDLSGWKKAPDSLADVGAEAAAAFRGAFDDNLFGTETIEGFSKTAGDTFKDTFNRVGRGFDFFTGRGADRFDLGMAQIRTGLNAGPQGAATRNVGMDDAARSTMRATRSAEDMRKAMEGIKPVVEDVDAAGTNAMNNIAGGAGGAKDKVNELADTIEQNLQSNLEKMRDMFADTFTDIVTGTKSVRQGIADILKDMARAIASSVFRDWFGKLFGVGKPGGNGFWGGVASFLFGGIGANADGTNNWRGGLTAINERGPEIVDLPSGTRIIPADLSRRMAMAGGGGGAAVEIMLSQDLEGRILKEAENQSIRIVEGGIKTYDSQILPRRVSQVSNEPRRIG